MDFAATHAGLCRSLAGKYAGTTVTRDMVEDAVQQAWVAYLRHQARLDPATVQPWLYTVARNELFKLMRRSRQVVPVAQVYGQQPSFDNDVVERVDLERAMAALRPMPRTAMTAKLLGLSYEQVQEATGRSHTWVNRHTTRGRRALREATA